MSYYFYLDHEVGCAFKNLILSIVGIKWFSSNSQWVAPSNTLSIWVPFEYLLLIICVLLSMTTWESCDCCDCCVSSKLSAIWLAAALHLSEIKADPATPTWRAWKTCLSWKRIHSWVTWRPTNSTRTWISNTRRTSFSTMALGAR